MKVPNIVTLLSATEKDELFAIFMKYPEEMYDFVYKDKDIDDSDILDKLITLLMDHMGLGYDGENYYDADDHTIHPFEIVCDALQDTLWDIYQNSRSDWRFYKYFLSLPRLARNASNVPS